MKLLAGALAVLLLPSLASAEGEIPDTEAEAIRFIESSDPLDIARGAYAATVHDWRGAVPALLVALRECAEPDADVPEPAILSLFTALTHLDAAATAADLIPWARRRGHHLGAVLKIAVGKSMPDVLLELYDHAEGCPAEGAKFWMYGPAWLAAGNTLAKSRTPGFAVRVLRRLRLEMTVVADDEGGPDIPPPDRGAGSTSHTTLTVPDGYPPVEYYAIDLDDRMSGTPLTRGPTATAYLRRMEISDGVNKLAHPSGGVDWLATQVGWLASLIGKATPELPLSARSTKLVAFGSADDFRMRAAAIRDGAIAGYWVVVRALIEKGLLTTEEARTIGPQIAFSQRDDRKETRKGFLPDLPHPRLNCPFPLGDGPAPGTLPSGVRLAVDNPASVTVLQYSVRSEKQVGSDWAARFRLLVGNFSPDRYTPSLPAFSPGHDIVFSGPIEVTVRLSLEHEHAAVLASGGKLPGYWSFRGSRSEVLRMLIELFPPNKDPDSWLGRLPEKYRDVLENPSKVGVYCMRAAKSRVPDENWVRRFRALVGCPGSSRYYLNLPTGLFRPEYEVVFDPPTGSTFPDNECIVFRICPTSGYVAMRRSDMGFGGFWSYAEERGKIVALLREVFPEDDRLK